MHRPWLHLATLVVASAFLVGCGEADGWQGSTADSAGVQIVTNTGDGLWGPDEGWTIRQDLTIGTAEGEPEYQFGQVSGIDVGSDGRIYVLDQQAHEIRVFSPAGAFIAAMGQAGSGPGELSQAAGPLFVAPGDTVVVPDMMQQRITLYTASGEPAGSHTLPMASGLAVKWMEEPDAELVQQAMIMAMPGQDRADVEPKNLLIRRSPTGEVLDTILEMPIGQSIDFSGSAPRFTLFESEPVWTLGPDGRFYTGINSEYSVSEYSPSGDLTQIIRRSWEPRPITESDQDEYVRALREIWQQQGLPPQALDQLAQQIQFADTYPAYANVMGGPDGTLWVQGVQTPDEVRAAGGTFNMQDLGSASWEVFNADGQLLGEIRMPPRFTPLAFLGDALYGVLRDELDVQYVARMIVDRGDEVVGE